MDLLQLNKFYHPEVGGIEEVVRAIAEGMTRRGHESRVLVSVPRGWGARDAAGIPVGGSALQSRNSTWYDGRPAAIGDYFGI